MPTLENTPLRLFHGDCVEVMTRLKEESIDAVVTDPPYALTDKYGPRIPQYGNGRGAQEERLRRGQSKGFMGLHWDGELPRVDAWRAVLRVLKPGGYMLTMGGTRTYHRLACAVEDAGFEIRDCLMWLYGTGFPKGQGCLKPAYEPILLARKPGKGVLPLGIDECRIPTSETYHYKRKGGSPIHGGGMNCEASAESHSAGRYPANVVHDGSDEVLEAFAAFGEKKAGVAVRRNGGGGKPGGNGRTTGEFAGGVGEDATYGGAGTAARFFYCAKASKSERGEGNGHPTVKPLALMEWLVRLISSPGQVVLDPFNGSGTTALACLKQGRRYVGIEKEAEYLEITKKRIQGMKE